MATIGFTAHLRDRAPTQPGIWPGETIREVFEAVCAEYPGLKDYVVDEQDRLRKHVAVFLDGARLPAQAALETPVAERSEIFIMQALSGG